MSTFVAPLIERWQQARAELAAATALNDGNVRAPIRDCQEWVKVASVVPEVEG